MSLPPGPRRPPAAQTLAWVARPIPFLHASRRRYGDVFTVRLAQVGTFVFVSDPALLKSVFTAPDDLLRAGEANVLLEPLLGARSVLLLDGAEHLRQRKLMLPAFHGERMTRYGELMAEVTEAAVSAWPIGQRMALQPRLQAITLEIILRAVCGVSERGRREPLRAAIVRLLEVGTSPMAMIPWLRRDLGPASPWRRFEQAVEEVDRLLLAEIARRRQAEDLVAREDILSLLLGARDEAGEPMTDRELRDELVTLLVAGHETTATGLSWAFERVLRDHAVHERLRAESRDGDEHAYADAVVKETLRRRPPIPIVARRTAVPWALGAWTVPAGVRIAPVIYLIHHREDLYPEPFAFRPERFLDGGPAESYTWLPFGGGVRRCLGASFALFEMRTVLRAIMARTDLEVTDARREPVRRRAIVLAPAAGASVVVRPSESAKRPRVTAGAAASGFAGASG